MLNKPVLQLYSEFYPMLATQTSDTDEESLETIVFLHGWGIHAGIWSQVIEKQRQSTNCLVIDLPGMGRSPLPQGEYTLDFMIHHIIHVLESYQHHELHLVGWSLGAILAVELVQHVKYRNKSFTIMSATLVAMGPYFIEREKNTGLCKQEFDYFCTMLNEDLEGTLYRFLALNTKGSSAQRAEIRLLQQLVFTYGLPARKALIGGLEILGQADLSSYLKSPLLPTQIILGECDSIVPVSVARWLNLHAQKIPVSILKNTGHIPFLSQLHDFHNVLKEYVEKSVSREFAYE